MFVSQELAKLICATNYENLPQEAVFWAKTAIIDTIGVAIAGSQESSKKIVEKICCSNEMSAGPCLVFGGATRMGVLNAALINGTAGHALDYDDTSKTLGGHPSVVMVPALIALGETIGSTGRNMIEAYVAGFETATSIGRGVNFHHYEKGWHPTATLGIFGTAASCSRLLKLLPDQTANALSICTSLAAGVKANFGTMTKPLHAGATARSGLFAALLAKECFTASPDAFEQSQGFFEVFNGTNHYAIEKIFQGWENQLDIIKTGVSIKQYPCVYSTHPAIDAAIMLHKKNDLTEEQIKDVEVCLHRRRLLPHTTKPATCGLNAKFSLPYVVARSLLSGRVVLEHFEDNACSEPAIQSLMKKIHTKPHNDDDKDYSGSVTVTFNNGTTIQEHVASPRGRGPENPLSQEDLKNKFLDCASRTIAVDHAVQLYDTLAALEHVESVSAVTRLIELS